jgi:protein-tyrosine phosphatase
VDDPDRTPSREDPAQRREVRLLFTCTANRVRSPFAEHDARRRLQQRGLPAEVRSAGLMEAGRAAVQDMVEVAREHGLDLSPHRSETVIAEDLEQADLIVPMTGWHVVQLVEVLPAAQPRIVTLSEWAALTTAGRGLGRWTPVEVRSWAAASVATRQVGALLSGEHDIEDPIGGPRRGYRRAAQEIDEALVTCLSAPNL